MAPEEIPSNNLWVGNLAPDVTAIALMSLFQSYGPLESITAYTPDGFGFVQFRNINDSMEAKRALEGFFFHGIAIKIKFSMPEQELEFRKIRDGQHANSRIDLPDHPQHMPQDVVKYYSDPIHDGFTRQHEQGLEFQKINDEHPNRRIDHLDYPQLKPQDFVRNYSDPVYAGFTRQHEQGLEFREMRGIGRPNPRLMTQDFVRNDSHPMNAGFTRQHEQGLEFREMRDGHYLDRGIGRPNTRLMPQDFVRNDSHPTNAGFTRQHKQGLEFQEIRDGHYPNRGIDGPNPRLMSKYFVRNDSHPTNSGFTRQHEKELEFRENRPRRSIVHPDPRLNPFQPARMIGHNPLMLASNVSGRLPTYGPDIPSRPLSMHGRFLPIQASLTSHVLSSPSGEQKPPSRFVVPGLDAFRSSQLQRETKRLRIEGANDDSYPHKRTSDRGSVLDEQYGLVPSGSNVPSGPVIVSQANNTDARISPGQHHSGSDFIWRGIITKNGISVCHAICVPVGESIKYEIPDELNCYAGAGLDRLTEHYANAAVAFSIVSFLPDAETDWASYREFLRSLSMKDRAGVAKLLDGTNMFLVPPSDFITKVLKIDGPACLYGVVLKYAPNGTSLPQESIQYQYVEAPEITPHQLAQARRLLTDDIVKSLEKLSGIK